MLRTSWGLGRPFFRSLNVRKPFMKICSDKCGNYSLLLGNQRSPTLDYAINLVRTKLKIICKLTSSAIYFVYPLCESWSDMALGRIYSATTCKNALTNTQQ